MKFVKAPHPSSGHYCAGVISNGMLYIYLVRHQQIHLREKPRKVESKQRSTCASQEFLIFWSLQELVTHM